MRKVSRIQAERNKLKKQDKEKMWNVFLEVWRNREHKCSETGERLNGEPLSVYFHHVLEKEIWPQFQFEKWNIVLVSWQTHDQVHKDLDKCPKIKQYRELLKKQLNL